MKVKIRHELEAKALDFGDIETTDKALGELMAMVKAWGVRYEGESEIPDVSGEFVITPVDAYFEVLMHVTEED